MKQTLIIVFFSLIGFLSCNFTDKQHVNVSSNVNQKSFERAKKYPDSSVFWFNERYIDCINSGTAVCECLSKNEFVMLHLDKKNNSVLIQSSVYFFGLETSSEFDIKRLDEDSLKYEVEEIWPLSNSMAMDLTNDNQLKILYNNKKYSFIKKRLKTLAVPRTPKGLFTYRSEIWTQRNTFNSKSLLAYPYTDKENQLFSPKELKKLINDNKVTISCSDDFHYNSMIIKKGDSLKHFHLEYNKQKVSVYQEKPNGRNRHEDIKLDELKKQEFYMMKQK